MTEELLHFNIRLKTVNKLSIGLTGRSCVVVCSDEHAKLWTTPAAKVDDKGTVDWSDEGKYPVFDFAKIAPSNKISTSKTLLSLIFKLRSLDTKKKTQKTQAKWKVDAYRFYKKVELVNTVLLKDDLGPNIVLNFIDVCELKKKEKPPLNLFYIDLATKPNIISIKGGSKKKKEKSSGSESSVEESTDSKGTKEKRRSRSFSFSDKSEKSHDSEDKKAKRKSGAFGSLPKDDGEDKDKLKKRLSGVFSKSDKRSSSRKSLSKKKSSPSESQSQSEDQSVTSSVADWRTEDESEASAAGGDQYQVREEEASESAPSRRDSKKEKKMDKEKEKEKRSSQALAKPDKAAAPTAAAPLTKAFSTIEPKSDLFGAGSVIEGEEEPDAMYKIIIIGDSSVGKSNLLGRWMRDQFSFNLPQTVYIEFSTKSFKVDGKIIKIQFWDTAGQERFNALTRQYYQGAEGAVVMYSIAEYGSFQSISKWVSEFRTQNPDADLVLLGNKADLEKQRKVTTQEAVDYAKSQRLSFLETSAKDGTNCAKAMQILLQEIYSRNKNTESPLKNDKKELPDAGKGKVITLSNTPAEKPKRSSKTPSKTSKTPSKHPPHKEERETDSESEESSSYKKEKSGCC